MQDMPSIKKVPEHVSEGDTWKRHPKTRFVDGVVKKGKPSKRGSKRY